MSQEVRGTTSAPTSRVLDVVELLGRPHGGALRFSDIVRELGLTQGTAHSILKTLCDRGWVVRDPAAKTYALGPALAVIATHARGTRTLADAAQAQAVALATEVGFPASVLVRVADSLVFTACEGTNTYEHPAVPGDRIPYAPPFGVGFAAWDDVAQQQAWIERGANNDPALQERLHQVLKRTRERGFDVDWTTPALTKAAQLAGTLPREGLPSHVREVMDQLLVECIIGGVLPDDDPAHRAQPIATIATPIFDRHRHVALIIGVSPLRPMTPEQINSLGHRVVKAARTVSEESSQ